MWFRSILDSENATSRRRARPCLAALERLEDRVLLSAVSPVTPSWQSLAAVDALQKIESKFVDVQGDFLKAESSLVQQAGYKLSAPMVEYFYKIDGQLSKIDGDLVGSPTTDQGAGGLDGVLLADLKLPIATQKYMQDVLVPAVGQELELANKLTGLLANQTGGAEASVMVGPQRYGNDLKLDSYKLNGIPSLTVDFAQIENDLVAADPTGLGPALGLQGSPAPGPVGTLLEDMAALGVDASAPINSGPPTDVATRLAVDAFNKIELGLVGQQDELLKLETAFYKYSAGNPLSPAAVDYFLKIDTDLIQFDNDSVGPPVLTPASATTASAASTTAAPGGIDGVLLTLDLPADMLATIQNKIVPAVQEARTELMAIEQQLLGQQGSPPQGDPPGVIARKGGNENSEEYLKLTMQDVIITSTRVDPQGLGPLVQGLLNDMLVTTADEQVSLNFTKIPVTYDSAAADEHLSLNFTKIAAAYMSLIQTDPQRLGPLMGGILEDMLVLASDSFADGSVRTSV